MVHTHCCHTGEESQQPLNSCIKRPATWLHSLINENTITRGNPTMKMFYLHTIRQITLSWEKKKFFSFFLCLTGGERGSGGGGGGRKKKVSLVISTEIWNPRSNCIYLSMNHFHLVRKISAIIPTDSFFSQEKNDWPGRKGQNIVLWFKRSVALSIFKNISINKINT